MRGRMILALEGAIELRQVDAGGEPRNAAAVSRAGPPVLRRLPPRWGEHAGSARKRCPRAAGAPGVLSEIDRGRERRAAAEPQGAIVIADRSWLGLLGHLYAVERTGGPAAYEAAHQLVEASAGALLQPDLVLQLVVDPGERRNCADETEENEWFTSEPFNRELELFWSHAAPGLVRAGSIRRLDANESAATVLASSAARRTARALPSKSMSLLTSDVDAGTSLERSPKKRGQNTTACPPTSTIDRSALSGPSNPSIRRTSSSRRAAWRSWAPTRENARRQDQPVPTARTARETRSHGTAARRTFDPSASPARPLPETPASRGREHQDHSVDRCAASPLHPTGRPCPIACLHQGTLTALHRS